MLSPPSLLIACATAAALIYIWRRHRHPDKEAVHAAPELKEVASEARSTTRTILAALDVGSINHKMCVAEIDITTRSIKRVLLAEQKQVMIKHALLQTADQRLPSDILEASRDVLAGFRSRALALGATRFAGVATAAFRHASNGEHFLAEINDALGLRVRVISQRLEGELGYLSASLGLPAAQQETTMVAWDSGGGSYQVSARVGGELRVWCGPLGDSDVAKMLLQLQGRSLVGVAHGARSSSNPVRLDDARRLVEALDARLPPCPPWLRELCAAGARVIGYGERTSLCALPSELHGHAHELSAAMVWEAAEMCVGRTDEELLAEHGDLQEEEDLALPKLMLCYTMMTRRLGIDTVAYVKTCGNCQGVLQCAELWRAGAQRRVSSEGVEGSPGGGG